MKRRRHRRRLSAHARAETPLAIEYRQAKRMYKRAGLALRRSCGKGRVCGFPRAPKGFRVAYTSPSVAAMEAEFLGAPTRDGTNEDVLRRALGNLTVRDATTWEPIRERYEVKKPIETFEQAFAVLARMSRRGRRSLSWLHFDLATLRECPGLSDLQLPARLLEAQNEGEIRAKYYGEEAPF